MLLRARRFAAYLANDGELDPSVLIGRLLTHFKLVAVPVVGRTRRLEFRRYRRKTVLRRNRYGIAEPGPRAPAIDAFSLDVVFLPLVAFDDAGHRLGMGGGYYDATFASPHRALLIGLAHEGQRVAALPRESWDVALDAVITEAAIHRFTMPGHRLTAG